MSNCIGLSSDWLQLIRLLIRDNRSHTDQVCSCMWPFLLSLVRRLLLSGKKSRNVASRRADAVGAAMQAEPRGAGQAKDGRLLANSTTGSGVAEGTSGAFCAFSFACGLRHLICFCVLAAWRGTCVNVGVPSLRDDVVFWATLLERLVQLLGAHWTYWSALEGAD